MELSEEVGSTSGLTFLFRIVNLIVVLLLITYSEYMTMIPKKHTKPCRSGLLTPDQEKIMIKVKKKKQLNEEYEETKMTQGEDQRQRTVHTSPELRETLKGQQRLRGTGQM